MKTFSNSKIFFLQKLEKEEKAISMLIIVVNGDFLGGMNIFYLFLLRGIAFHIL